MCNIVKQNFEILSNDELVGKEFKKKPMFAYKRDKNLKDMLVRSRLTKEENGTTKTCDRSRCLTCPHVNSSNRIVGPRGFIDIREQFTCISEGLIYVIECRKCGSLYVGETGRRLADRFREHRRMVINKRTEQSEVAGHFSADDHSVDDMSISGVMYCRDIKTRKLKEQKLISKFLEEA